MGTGLSEGVFWRDMGVINLPSKQPILNLTGGAEFALAKMLPKGYTSQVNLTISDDFPWAQAIVIISCVPSVC